MSINEMFGQSAILALLGMAVVFSFLIILVVVMNLLKKLVMARKWDGDIEEETPPAGRVGPGIAAAASAAVNEYRKTH